MHRWFWKCGILFFLRANYIMGHFKGYFEGARARICKRFRSPGIDSEEFYIHIGTFNLDKRNPAKYPSLAKIRQSMPHCHILYSSTEQLQVALWTYMFFKLGLNKVSSHPPSSISPSTSSPSTIPPSPNPPSRPLNWSVGILKHIGYLSVLSAGNLI